MQDIIDYWLKQFEIEGNIVVGNTQVLLMANESITRCKESNTGNYVADTMREWSADSLTNHPPLPILAVINAGALRWTTDVYANTSLTKGSILNLLPFGNFITVIKTNGTVLRNALENSVSTLPTSFGGFLQISGFKYSHDCKIISSGDGICSSPPGSRVLNITYIDGSPVQPTDDIYLALPDYLAQGGNSYIMFINETVIIDPENSKTIFDTVINDIIMMYWISPTLDGRIIEL